MRSLRRWLGIRYLVLATMVAQACVAFGHVHLSHAKPSASSLQGRTLVAYSKHRSCPPAHQHDSGCVICWAVGIGGATVVHELDALAAPECRWSFQPIRVVHAAPAIEASAFDARGPPGEFT